MADYSRNWQEILRRYRVYVAVEKRLAENTVEAYMRDVERLATFPGRDVRWMALSDGARSVEDAEALAEYVNSL